MRCVIVCVIPCMIVTAVTAIASMGWLGRLGPYSWSVGPIDPGAVIVNIKVDDILSNLVLIHFCENLNQMMHGHFDR